ncbi:MAG: hypothetical protein GWP16_00075, partial [Nitrospirae bacterium]|nr:hypothetical protein [Nitrospirota bacterium]
PELQRRFETLRGILDSVEEPEIPERHPSYGSVVWHRLAPQLEQRRSRFWNWQLLKPRRQWTLVAATLLLVVVAFLAGRLWPRQPVEIAAIGYDGQERILLLTVADHLERSEMLLVELANTRENGEFDISAERQLAGQLKSDSRLYRQAAKQSGQADVAALLEQLERVLVELANSPETIPSSDLGELRALLDEGDLLFKVRIVGSRLREEGRGTKNPVSEERSALDV